MAKFTAEQIAKFEANLQAYADRQKSAKLTAHLDREKQTQADMEARKAQEANKLRSTNNSDRYKLATSEQVIARAQREAITCQPDSEMAKARRALARFAEGKHKLADYEARLAEQKALKAEKVDGYVKHKTYLAETYKPKAQQLYKNVRRVLEIIDGKRVWKVKYAW